MSRTGYRPSCLENAKTAKAYQQLFLDAGFQPVSIEDEGQSLKDMIADLKRKLLMAGLGKTLGVAGNIQYCRMVFARDQVNHKADRP